MKRSSAPIADAYPLDRTTRLPVHDQQGLFAFSEDPPVTPLAKGGEYGDEVLSYRRELVLEARAVTARVDGFENAVVDEMLESVRQDVLRYAEVRFEVRETAGTQKRLP